MLDVGCWMLDVGCWMLDVDGDVRHWTMAPAIGWLVNLHDGISTTTPPW
jgi:hypothetical protein